MSGSDLSSARGACACPDASGAGSIVCEQPPGQNMQSGENSRVVCPVHPNPIMVLTKLAIEINIMHGDVPFPNVARCACARGQPRRVHFNHGTIIHKVMEIFQVNHVIAKTSERCSREIYSRNYVIIVDNRMLYLKYNAPLLFRIYQNDL